MTMTDSLDGLIERVERCTGPDRELDYAIAVFGRPGELIRRYGYKREPGDDGWYSITPPIAGAERISPPQPYTDSIDAALHLARDHLGGATMWSVCEMEEGPFAQLIRPMPDGGYVGGVTGSYGNSAPLAIILAALRALQSIKTSETPT